MDLSPPMKYDSRLGEDMTYDPKTLVCSTFETLSITLKSTVNDLTLISTFANLQDLTLIGDSTSDRTRISGLADLSKLPGLRKLTLKNLQYRMDLASLTDLQGLQELTLINCSNCAIRYASRLTGLTTLHIKALMPVGGTLECLSSMVNLTALTLDCGPWIKTDNIDFLYTMHKLDYLSLTGFRGVKSLAALANCHHLQTLMVTGTMVTVDLSPILQLPLLTTLALRGMRVDTMTLYNLPSTIETLSFHEVRIVDLSVMTHLKHLRNLWLGVLHDRDEPLVGVDKLIQLRHLKIHPDYERTALRSSLQMTKIEVITTELSWPDHSIQEHMAWIKRFVYLPFIKKTKRSV